MQRLIKESFRVARSPKIRQLGFKSWLYHLQAVT